MSQIMRLRVILDTEDDVFRDIEIQTDAPLMHLHFAVLDAFGWESGRTGVVFPKRRILGSRKGIFLAGHERPHGRRRCQPEDAMNQSTVGDLMPSLASRAIYVYDFLRMWCFYVEPVTGGRQARRRLPRAVPRIWHPSRL